MPENLDESTPIDIPCPKCGHKLTKSIRELKTNTKFACPKCGQGFDSADFKAEIQKVDKAIDDLKRQIGKLGNG